MTQNYVKIMVNYVIFSTCYNKGMNKNRIPYTAEGYIDFEKVMEQDPSDYIFMIGARAIGKTFGALKYALDHQIKFIFMRRTQTQVDLIKSDDLSPFRALEQLGNQYMTTVRNINKNITGVYRMIFDPEAQDYVPESLPIGYVMALSTVSNIRGFDASDVDLLIYDEFIGEKHEKPIRSEGTAFMNAIETIARNRELQGRKPMKVVCLANSTDLANPIFIELKMITICEKMIKAREELKTIRDRDMSIYILNRSPISLKKAQTSLYRLSGTESEFSQMSLENQFNKEYFGQVKSCNLKEYRPLVTVGEISIYKHKSQRRWYVSDHTSGSPEKYDSSDIELKRFQNDYYYLKLAYLNRHVFFESYIQQVLFETYMHMI